jgi:hypothetical protein
MSWYAPAWQAPPGVRAAFSTRAGGASAGPWASLNVATHVGDDPVAVRENRRRLHASLALPAEPRWLEQVHGTDILDADAADPRAIAARADAIVTRGAGVVCAIQVADCLPVLLASRDGGVLGAAHAGWRGLAAGVLERTVDALAVESDGLTAWLGPCIGPEAFEVGEEVRAAFLDEDGGAGGAFVPNARGRWQCDLVALARRRLARRGVTRVASDGRCTFREAGRFFSHRREAPCGRMVALLWREGGP